MSAVLNASYFAELTAEINSIDVCADLQAVVSRIMAELQAQISAIESQIAALLPLITLPTNLGEVIAWIGKFATPLIAAYEKYLAQLQAALAQVSALVQAIEGAASRIVNCAVTIERIV